MSYFAITSNHPRHMEFLKTLYEKIELSVVVVIDKGAPVREEFDYFGPTNMHLMQKPNVLRCTKHQLHSNFVLQTLQKTNPKVGFTFGAPLLKQQLHNMPEYGCVNIHTGLVNHYRGVDSSLWAMYDNKPELIGATLHYIDDTIDAGNIIGMSKASINKYDTLDTLFYKSCETGFQLLFDNISDIITNTVKREKLKVKGKLYQNKDKNSEIVKKAEDNLRRYKK